jgi:hypothetical protein
VWTRIIQINIWICTNLRSADTLEKLQSFEKKGFPHEPRYAGTCTFSTKNLRHWCMQFETPACTILFLYQNHLDTPSETRDLYESISMPDSQLLLARVISHFAPKRVESYSTPLQNNTGHNGIFHILLLLLKLEPFLAH